MPEFPDLHPSITATLVKSISSAQFQFFPVNLDLKQAEVARNLLINDRESCFISHWQPSAIPIFLSTDPDLESLYCNLRPKLSVILDLHDKGTRFDFLGLTEPTWKAIKEAELQVLYFKLQIHDAGKYRLLNLHPDNVHVLAMPLLPGGSRFHITVQQDFEGDALFSRNLRANHDPIYEYDWSWVGANTSDDRKAAFELLEPFQSKKRFCTISKPGHSDASVATVPQSEYLKISRSSKISMSLNGRGPWCLKDGELFSQECFILRQDHPSLSLHPLSPQDGRHWAIAGTSELIPAIEHLCNADQERERMRRAGYLWMKDVLQNNLWSNEHIRRLNQFIGSCKKDVWSGIAIA